MEVIQRIWSDFTHFLAQYASIQPLAEKTVTAGAIGQEPLQVAGKIVAKLEWSVWNASVRLLADSCRSYWCEQ